jgi:hypothetical protein
LTRRLAKYTKALNDADASRVVLHRSGHRSCSRHDGRFADN